VFAPNKSQVAAEFLSLCFRSVLYRDKKDKKGETKKEKRSAKVSISFSLLKKFRDHSEKFAAKHGAKFTKDFLLYLGLHLWDLITNPSLFYPFKLHHKTGSLFFFNRLSTSNF
jgi:hypothetical protein